jgi:hypothetical protein
MESHMDFARLSLAVVWNENEAFLIKGSVIEILTWAQEFFLSKLHELSTGLPVHRSLSKLFRQNVLQHASDPVKLAI